MKTFLIVGGVAVLTVVCLLGWAVVAMDYGDSVAAGTYYFKNGNEGSTLQLDRNHTFRQLRKLNSVETEARGTWRHVGEGGISFSKEFIAVSGDEPEPDGTTFCDMHKFLGLFTSLRLRQYHVLWYGKVGAGTSLAGQYKGDELNVIATLTLGDDHSFAQTITINNMTKRANGTWSQDKNGTVWFSNQFLKSSGESLSADESASSIDPQDSNLQIEVTMAGHKPEAIFHKGF